MTVEFEVYSSEVCKTNSGIQRYKVVIKSVERTTGFEKVVITIENLMEFIVEKHA